VLSGSEALWVELLLLSLVLMETVEGFLAKLMMVISAAQGSLGVQIAKRLSSHSTFYMV